MAARILRKPRGVVLHRGKSSFDGSPFVVIAVFHSENTKTGDMVQVFILLDNGISPPQNVKENNDGGICFNCALKGESYIGRVCYVNTGNSPYAVWECYMAGGYPEYEPKYHDRYFMGREVRWGAYGEPVLIPIELMQHLSSIANGWTGYTHQWRRREFAKYRRYLMASTHTIEECRKATAKGWRWFKSANKHTPEQIAELQSIAPCFNCPASDEGGHRVQCRDCCACDGNMRPIKADPQASVWIDTHGNKIVMRVAAKLPVLQ